MIDSSGILEMDKSPEESEDDGSVVGTRWIAS